MKIRTGHLLLTSSCYTATPCALEDGLTSGLSRSPLYYFRSWLCSSSVTRQVRPRSLCAETPSLSWPHDVGLIRVRFPPLCFNLADFLLTKCAALRLGSRGHRAPVYL